MLEALVLAAEAPAEEGGNALIDVVPGLMIWTVITFAIVLFVLRRFAFGDRLLALLLRQLAELARLVARLVGLVERLANPLSPLVDQALDATERELPKDEKDDREGEDRPDHQAGDDVDERAAAALLRRGLRCENERFQHQTRT